MIWGTIGVKLLSTTQFLNISVPAVSSRQCLSSAFLFYDFGEMCADGLTPLLQPATMSTTSLPQVTTVIETRRTHLKLCTFYNFVHSHSVPPFTINYRSPNDYSIRSHHNLAITQPYAHTNQYLHSFFPSTVSLWNKLSQETVNATSIHSFKNAITSHFHSSPI